MNKPTQCDRLLQAMRDTNGYITPMAAWQLLGIYRLAARIHDLKSKGIPVESKVIEVTNKFGESVKVAGYRLGATS